MGPPFFASQTMLTKATPRIEFDYQTNKWVTPPQWGLWEWINDPDNYPDPNFDVFKNEFDFGLINERGILHRYKNHIYGSTKEYRDAKGKSIIKTFRPKCYQYFLFARAAVRLINEPELYREALENKLNGSIVINYLNLVTIYGLIPPNTVETDKDFYLNLGKSKHLVSAEYGASMARVFNATSGLHLHVSGQQYELKTEKREDKYALCPSCESIYTQLTREVVEAGSPKYKEAMKKLVKQIEYDRHRRENG